MSTRRSIVRTSILAALAGAAAGCADDPLARSTGADAARPPAGGPAAVLNTCTPYSGPRSNATSISPGPGDDTCLIQDAVNRFHHVHLAQGTYDITGTIVLPSLTRVYGDGMDASIIRQDAPSGADPTHVVDDRRNIFLTRGTAATPVLAVTVESLGFQGTGIRWQFALRAERTNDVVFQNNRATNVGLFNSGHYDHDDLPTSMGELNHNLRLANNHGVGSGSRGALTAIEIGYARDVRVENNHVRDYNVGIQWWGGNADPNHRGANYDRWMRNFLAQHNSVQNTDVGLWGSRGDSIRVYSNTVAYCHDVCLDAEGSRDVVFRGNTASHAGTAVLAVYFNSQDVHFEQNTAVQDGSYGTRLFGSTNPSQVPSHPDIPNSAITFRLHDNTLRYEGATGIGLVQKESSQEFRFTANRLYNTVVDLSFWQMNGYTEITDNAVELHRDAGKAGILATRNWQSQAIIDRNVVTAHTAQSQPGIHVVQNGPAGWPEVYSQVNANRVTGFRRAVQVEGNGEMPARFHVQGNVTNGSFRTAGAYFTLFEADNTWAPAVLYSAWVSEGQLGTVADGAQAGTTGQSRPMRGLAVSLGAGMEGIGVCYQAHVGYIGWMGEVCNGQYAGSPDLGNPNYDVQAVTLRLVTPDPAMRICAEAHVANIGWMGETCGTGAITVGTTGQSLDMQAIRIRIDR